MVASLATALLALRAGLALRRSRAGLSPAGGPGRAALRRRHLRLAKPAVALVAVGFLGGPTSMWWLRGRTPFGTVHAFLGAAVLSLFAATWVLGRRLERGRGRPLDAHALCGVLAVLAACLAAIAGFVLLP